MNSFKKTLFLIPVFIIALLSSCHHDDLPDGKPEIKDNYIGDFHSFELTKQTTKLFEKDLACHIMAPDGSIIIRYCTHDKGDSLSKFHMSTGLKDNNIYRLLYFEYKLPEPIGPNMEITTGTYGLGMRIELKDGNYKILDTYDVSTEFNGCGTENSPYIITAPDHLTKLREITNTQSTQGLYFKQESDIDMYAEAYRNDNNFYWTPIGYDNNMPFCGFYNGNEKTISNLISIGNGTNNGNDMLTKDWARGLFGYVKCASISNLVIEDSYFEGSLGIGSVAGIVIAEGGEIETITNIYNCKVCRSDIKGRAGNSASIGGIVGLVNAHSTLNITNCVSNACRISSQYNAGGVVGSGGEKSIVIINKCSNSSTITVENGGAGGIISNADSVSVASSINEASATITGPASNNNGTSNIAYGGIVAGARGAWITACENQGSVSGEEGVGGIIGSTRACFDENNGYIFHNAYLRYCKNSGEVKGNNNVGGLCGEGQVGCYAGLNTGNVSGEGQYIGGIAGNTSASVIYNSINNGTIKGESYIAGITAKSSTSVYADCQNYGTVSGDEGYVAGIVGYGGDYSMIHYCANYGAVSSKKEPLGGIAAKMGLDQTLSPLNKAEIAFGAIQVAGSLMGPIFAVVEKIVDGSEIILLGIEAAKTTILGFVETGFLGAAGEHMNHETAEQYSLELTSTTEEWMTEMDDAMTTIRSEASPNTNSLLSSTPISELYPSNIKTLSKYIQKEGTNEDFNDNINNKLHERIETIEQLNHDAERNYIIAGAVFLVTDIIALAASIATGGAIIPVVMSAEIACMGGMNSIHKGVSDYTDNIIMIVQCLNAGPVTGIDSKYVGGIVGHMGQRGYITQCVNSGSGPGKKHSGEIVGYLEKEHEFTESLALRGPGTSWGNFISEAETDKDNNLDFKHLYSFTSTPSYDYYYYTQCKTLDNSDISSANSFETWSIGENEPWIIVASTDGKATYPIINKSIMQSNE